MSISRDSTQAVRVGIVSDLHLDDRNIGRHLNYFSNCCNICEQITEMVKREELTHLILLGDLFGNTQHIVKRQSARVAFASYFKQWNELTNDNVYTLAGNHDSGAYATDFDLMCASGLVKHPKRLCLGDLCFHFFDYGEETRVPEIEPIGYNIALMHAHLTVDEQTNFIRIQGGTELSTLENLAGCTLVVSGHIHNPSKHYLKTRIKGQDVMLYYPGNPTRPRKEPDLWEEAYMLVISEDGKGEISEKAVPFELKPIAELFKDSPNSSAEETLDDGEIQSIEALQEILANLQTYGRTVSGGYRSQLERLGATDLEAKAMALKYIEQAESIESEKSGANPNI